MKILVRLFLLPVMLLSSCSTSKIVNHDVSTLQNHWIHSHEEDTDHVKVFRPSTYDFQASRGREAFILDADGQLIYTPLSMNDKPVSYQGSWEVEKSKLRLHYDDQVVVYKILEMDANTLKLK